MAERYTVRFSSAWHDPVDHIDLKKDPRTGDIYHRGSYYEEWRENDLLSVKRKKVLPYLPRLSKDPVRRGSQVRWLRSGVDPFEAASLLRYARTAKDPAGRWLALHDLEKYGLLTRSCAPALKHIVRSDRSTDAQALALHLLSRVEGPNAEGNYIIALQAKTFRFKFTPLECIHQHGTSRSVPAVCEYLDRTMRRPASVHAADQWDTERSFAARFLDRFLDTHAAVEDVFKTVIRYWTNLAYQESRCVLNNVRYIGIRVLEPADPEVEPNDGRVTVKAPGFHRRLWQNKERFRGGIVRPKRDEDFSGRMPSRG
jgi:hypothetical protein